MGDDEVRICHVDIDRHGGQEQSGQSTEGEQPQKPERIQHRGLERDLAPVKRGSPVEHFDRGRNGDHE